MKYLVLLFLAVITQSAALAQTATQLYTSRNFQALAKLEPEAARLKPEELYMVGFAFFRLGDDKKAVDFYDKALAKGLNNGSVHFYKGLSLRLLHNYAAALPEMEAALKLEPANQEFMNEKGLVFYDQDNKMRALEVFEQAKKLPATYPEPYYWAARIHHENNEFAQALAGYYEAIKLLSPTNSQYFQALVGIGQLEYTFTRNFQKSAAAYAAASVLDNNNYELYYKLMKSYNASQAYARADSVFTLVKTAFDNGQLPKEDMEIKSVAIAQFNWRGQVATIRRALVEAREPLDITYKVFLLDEAGTRVVRRFVVEKTVPIEKTDARYLLCEQVKATGGHFTYPYGWATATISAGELEKAVGLVLDGKMSPSASSNFSR